MPKSTYIAFHTQIAVDKGVMINIKFRYINIHMRSCKAQLLNTANYLFMKMLMLHSNMLTLVILGEKLEYNTLVAR